jgi:hypothetical protein
VQRLMGQVEAIRDETSSRLKKRDRLVRAALRRRAQRGEYPTTLFHFRVGELVMRRCKRIGKLAPKADGPYRVEGVRGLLGQRVAITPVGGTHKRKRAMLEVHAS